MAPLSVGVLISGRGSNLQALLDASATPGFPARIVLVVSNKPDAQGLERARRAGVATHVVSHRDHGTRESFDRAIDSALRAHGVDFVCLAGFMRLLSDWFVQTWRDRLINIHPSLLPSFKGLDAQAQALAAGVRLAGCTVHFVRSEMDTGPIIVQAAVPVRDGDTAEALSARILEAEHRSYPLALRLIAEGRVRVEDERVVIDGAQSEGLLISPDPGSR
ncbi:MAG: phosphoribosylglycinamide formyltransferase [Alphaproteobacteria bacterium]